MLKEDHRENSYILLFREKRGKRSQAGRLKRRKNLKEKHKLKKMAQTELKEKEVKEKNEEKEKKIFSLIKALEKCRQESQFNANDKREGTARISSMRSSVFTCKSAKNGIDVPSVMSKLPMVPLFSNDAIELIKRDGNNFEMLGKGAFGCVYLASMKNQGLKVAAKVVKNVAYNHILMEAKISQALCDHQSFLFCFGIWNKDGIILELADGYVKASTLYSTSTCKTSAVSVSSQLIRAVQYMHTKCILHNDIKSDNILYNQASGQIKVIDFGKARLLSFPKTYHIANTEQQAFYNKWHRFLAYELRNVPGACQSIMTDTYSVGYFLKYLGHHCMITALRDVGIACSNNDVSGRMTLETALLKL